jgi:ferrous iron transport protein A
MTGKLTAHPVRDFWESLCYSALTKVEFSNYPKKGVVKMRTLRDVPKGETATVVKLHGVGALKRRIMDMGITRGTEIFVRKVAPLGDPVEVRVRGYELSIRKDDAELIEVGQKEEDRGR